MNEELQALDDERDALAVKQAELRQQWSELAERRDAAVQRHLDTLTDEQLHTDDTAKRWLLRVASAHQGAYQRLQTVAAVGAPGAMLQHIDGRKEYEADCLPCFDLALSQGQPVEPLADAIRTWSAEWGLGRPDIPVSVLDAECGARGSYGGLYTIADDNFQLDLQHHSHRSNVTSGPLVDGLRYISEHVAFDAPTYDEYNNDY